MANKKAKRKKYFTIHSNKTPKSVKYHGLSKLDLEKINKMGDWFIENSKNDYDLTFVIKTKNFEKTALIVKNNEVVKTKNDF